MLGKYGIRGSLKLMFSVLYTKLRFPQARIIRLPFDIRNRKYIKIGNRFTCGPGCRFEAYPQNPSQSTAVLTIGENVQFNDYVHIVASGNITIGNNVLMASKIFISDTSHGYYGDKGQNSHPDEAPEKRTLHSSSVTIEDNVWIGEFVSILPGVTIGRGSIVGTMSVVSRDIPPYSIAAGSPARVIKKYNFEENKWTRV